MRLMLTVAALALAGCATVEERTEARSGAAFDRIGTGETGGQAQPMETEVRMQAPPPVPRTTLPGQAGEPLADAAARAAAAGAPGVTVAAQGGSFALAQVSVGASDFAVARPADVPLTGDGAQIAALASQRTGCLTSGQSWRVGDALVLGLDCS